MPFSTKDDAALLPLHLGIVLGKLSKPGAADYLAEALRADYTDEGLYSRYVVALRDKLTEVLQKAGLEQSGKAQPDEQ